MSPLRQFRRWSADLGLAGLVALDVAIFLASYAFVVQVHVFAYSHRWCKTTSHFDLNEIAAGVISGCVCAAFEFSDRSRAKETAAIRKAGKDRTMI